MVVCCLLVHDDFVDSGIMDDKDKIILDLKLKLEKSDRVIENLKSKIYRLQVANVHLLKVIKDACDLLYDKLIKEYEDN